MDMYQKRKVRQEKKNCNQEEKLTKVVINCDVGINGNHTICIEISSFL